MLGSVPGQLRKFIAYYQQIISHSPEVNDEADSMPGHIVIDFRLLVKRPHRLDGEEDTKRLSCT